MRDSFDILLLPGDGIGPEVVGAAREVVNAAADHFGIEFVYQVCAFLPLLGLLAVFLPDVRPPGRVPAPVVRNA